MSANWGECFFDHFEKYLRKPVDREVFTPQVPRAEHTIQMLAYDQVFEGCRAFCSLGLSHYPAEVGRVGEVFAPLDDGFDDVPYLVASALFYMVEQRMSLGWGVSIGGIQRLRPRFVVEYDKSAVYLSLPNGLPEGFSKVECGGKVGNIYQALFISSEEHKFLKERGAEAFETLLEESRADPLHLRRPSAV